jgi:GLPGLI family protein
MTEQYCYAKNSFQNNNYLQIWMMPYYYLMQTKDEMKWDICNDTKVENGFNMQKATTNFGGRNGLHGSLRRKLFPKVLINLEDYLGSFLR